MVRKAFTLIELIIVVFIITLTYAVFIQTFDFSQKSISTSLKTMQGVLESLRSTYGSTITVRCFDNCNECRVWEGDKDRNTTISIFPNGAEVNVYELQGNQVEKITFNDYYFKEFRGEPVCFEYNIYPNGSADKIIVEYDNNVILLDSYMHPPMEFDSVDSARLHWMEEKLKTRG